MTVYQDILVYLTLAVAVGYLVKKYLWPKRLARTKKSDIGCGQEDCGCH